MTDSSLLISPDTQAILLLCGHFGPPAPAPLTLGDYNEVARWLRDRGQRPADLLNASAAEVGAAFPAGHSRITRERLTLLLSRGVALGFEQERWSQQGIWVISRADEMYPKYLRQRLGGNAPVLLYGVGSAALLGAPALGVVGARDADAEALAFTREVGAQCAVDQLTVVSGGAKGVDQESVEATLAAGGSALVVLAEGVAKGAVSKAYRPGLASGQVALLSPFHPGARWTSGSAMARNKLIYCLSQATLVVSAGLDGGTWEGARENLRAGWVPLLVRVQAAIPAGNQALLTQGGHALEATQVAQLSQRMELLAGAPTLPGAPKPQTRHPYPALPSLFPAEGSERVGVNAPVESIGSAPAEGLNQSSTENLVAAPPDLLAVVWPYLQEAFTDEVPESALPQVGLRFQIQPTQLREWVKQAVSRGLLKKASKPVRYRIAGEGGAFARARSAVEHTT